jgi:uncharacterized protein YlxW (UPF0749 family)
MAVPLAAAVLGFLAVLAASQGGTPRREARRLELVDLIREQGVRVAALQRDVARLEESLDELRGGTAGAGEVGRQIRRLSEAAGGAALTGPGVVVTLDDSSSNRSPTGDPNDLVVHEQDIQTVVNALWAAGAEAMAVNGERLTSSSAVRCAGNTLLLHGRVHSPPYRIAAIGNPERLSAELETQPGMERLLAAVGAFGLGYDVQTTDVRLDRRQVTPKLDLAEPA